MKVVTLMACHNRKDLTIRALRSLFNQDFEGDLQVVSGGRRQHRRHS